MRVALIVDNALRDLRGLVLTGLKLCEYNMTCYLVPLNFQNTDIPALAPDFVLLPHLRKTNERMVSEWVDAGINCGVLDTEGGIFNPDLYDQIIATNAHLRAKIGLVCCWGSSLADHL